MKRKTFLKNTVPAAAIPFVLNGCSLRGCGEGSLFETAVMQSSKPSRVLVLVQLDGGNDGLSTVIPLDQYSALSRTRKSLLIPEKKTLSLHNTLATGLHPSMYHLQNLFNNGQVTVIQGVGYPDPVFSHFRAIDIWHTGSGSKAVLNSGWMGRFLEHQFPNYPKGYPSSSFPDPPAIQVGSVLSNALHGPAVGMGMAISSIDSFYDLVLGKQPEVDQTPYGRELAFINTTAMQTKQYLESVKRTAEKQKTLSGKYPPQGNNTLADQLKIVARLIGGGMQTKVYVVNLMGFDTHHNQADPSDPTKGTHAHLLHQLSEAVAAFEDDLHLMGKVDDVLGMTYSEFGRRITANASYGTDHGSSGPVFLFGSKLKRSLMGANPEVPANATVDDNLPLQFDYRSVYASVLKGWFQIPDREVEEVMLASYPVLDLFADSVSAKTKSV